MRFKAFWHTYVRIIDERNFIHKHCGVLLLIYSWIHTFGHLFGTYLKMNKFESVDELNLVTSLNLLNIFLKKNYTINNINILFIKHLNYGKLKKVLSYSELIFHTISGVTGILILIILTFMYVSSLDFFRKRHFEYFSYTHTLWFLYIIFLVLHGCDFMFNYGL